MTENLINKELNKPQPVFDVVMIKLCISLPPGCKMQIFFIYNNKSSSETQRHRHEFADLGQFYTLQNQVI